MSSNKKNCGNNGSISMGKEQSRKKKDLFKKEQRYLDIYKASVKHLFKCLLDELYDNVEFWKLVFFVTSVLVYFFLFIVFIVKKIHFYRCIIYVFLWVVGIWKASYSKDMQKKEGIYISCFVWLMCIRSWNILFQIQLLEDTGLSLYISVIYVYYLIYFVKHGNDTVNNAPSHEHSTIIQILILVFYLQHVSNAWLCTCVHFILPKLASKLYHNEEDCIWNSFERTFASIRAIILRFLVDNEELHHYLLDSCFQTIFSSSQNKQSFSFMNQNSNCNTAEKVAFYENKNGDYVSSNKTLSPAKTNESKSIYVSTSLGTNSKVKTNENAEKVAIYENQNRDYDSTNKILSSAKTKESKSVYEPTSCGTSHRVKANEKKPISSLKINPTDNTTTKISSWFLMTLMNVCSSIPPQSIEYLEEEWISSFLTCNTSNSFFEIWLNIPYTISFLLQMLYVPENTKVFLSLFPFVLDEVLFVFKMHVSNGAVSFSSLWKLHLWTQGILNRMSSFFKKTCFGIKSVQLIHSLTCCYNEITTINNTLQVYQSFPTVTSICSDTIARKSVNWVYHFLLHQMNESPNCQHNRQLASSIIHNSVPDDAIYEFFTKFFDHILIEQDDDGDSETKIYEDNCEKHVMMKQQEVENHNIITNINEDYFHDDNEENWIPTNQQQTSTSEFSIHENHFSRKSSSSTFNEKPVESSFTIVNPDNIEEDSHKFQDVHFIPFEQEPSQKQFEEKQNDDQNQIFDWMGTVGSGLAILGGVVAVGSGIVMAQQKNNSRSQNESSVHIEMLDDDDEKQ